MFDAGVGPAAGARRQAARAGGDQQPAQFLGAPTAHGGGSGNPPGYEATIWFGLVAPAARRARSPGLALELAGRAYAGLARADSHQGWNSRPPRPRNSAIRAESKGGRGAEGCQRGAGVIRRGGCHAPRFRPRRDSDAGKRCVGAGSPGVVFLVQPMPTVASNAWYACRGWPETSGP